ncbi:MAG: ECF transporter S component [Ruminococcaceae bacterium]|nr:ECF transporter S component [Oscillospiraceae bacterium]
MQKTRMSTQKLALLSLLTAITAILSYMGGFIKIGSLASISLTLIPVVLGAALCGPLSAAWLGGVAGAIFFTTADAVFWVGLSLHGTIITVMVKGILSGLFAGLCYKWLEKVNRYLAVVVSAIVCPVVNTGIFLIGCLIFFMDTIQSGAVAEGMSLWGYLLIFFVGLNFVFELLSNIIFSPVILRLINIRNKK